MCVLYRRDQRVAAVLQHTPQQGATCMGVHLFKANTANLPPHLVHPFSSTYVAPPFPPRNSLLPSHTSPFPPYPSLVPLHTSPLPSHTSSSVPIRRFFPIRHPSLLVIRFYFAITSPFAPYTSPLPPHTSSLTLHTSPLPPYTSPLHIHTTPLPPHTSTYSPGRLRSVVASSVPSTILEYQLISTKS